MTIDKHEFFKRVEEDLQELKCETKEEANKYFKNLEKVKSENNRKRQEELKQKLMDKIHTFRELKADYGVLINAIVNNNLRNTYEYKFAMMDIELLENKWSFIQNNYQKLSDEIKMELYLELEKQIKNSITMPFREYVPHIYVLETFHEQATWSFGQLVSDEEYDEYMNHFKLMICAYFKGFIMKDDTKAYMIEVLPSILWLLERGKVTNLFDCYLFEYPKGMTTEETEKEYQMALKTWYKEKGMFITSFEAYIEEQIENKEYKQARRVWERYAYLMEEEFLNETEKMLLNKVYEEYMQYQQIEDKVKKKTKINEIRNELLHFVK